MRVLRGRRPQDPGDLQRRRGRLPPARSGPRSCDALAARALGIRPPYLLFVGNPKPHKNLDNVVQAYARARRSRELRRAAGLRRRAARRHRVQDPPARRVTSASATRCACSGHVAQEALPAIYQGATLFLYPTLYEGFGLPVVEAMASGVAVITSNTSALQGDRRGLRPPGRPARRRRHGATPSPTAWPTRAPRRPAELGLRRAEDFRWDDDRAAARSTSTSRPSGSAARRPPSRTLRSPADRRPAERSRWSHDWLTGMRGGEKVLEAICGALPRGADLHPLPLPRQRQPGARDRIRSTPASCSAPPACGATTGATCRSSRRPSRSFDLAGFDLVVSSSHCVAKGVIPRAGRLPPLLLPHADALRLGPGARLLPAPHRRRGPPARRWRSRGCAPGTSPPRRA